MLSADPIVSPVSLVIVVTDRTDLTEQNHMFFSRRPKQLAATQSMLAVCLLLGILPGRGSSDEPVELDVDFLNEASEAVRPAMQPQGQTVEEVPSPILLEDVEISPSFQAPECGPTHHRHSRAGHPHKVAFWARPAREPKYTGYHVGGGVTPGRFSHGEYRFAHEGTWGRDYAPWYSRVQLLWSHGRLFQGGTGSYEPDHHNIPLGQRYGRRIRRGH